MLNRQEGYRDSFKYYSYLSYQIDEPKYIRVDEEASRINQGQILEENELPSQQIEDERHGKLSPDLSDKDSKRMQMRKKPSKEKGVNIIRGNAVSQERNDTKTEKEEGNTYCQSN